MDHKYIYFKLSSLHATIMHYYHFFYGVFIPLILEYIEYSKKYTNLTFIIGDDVGPMLRILLELPIDIKLKFNISNYDELNVEEKYLPAMDIHPTDNKRDLELIKKGWALKLTNDMYIKINNYMIDCIQKNDLLLNKNKNFDIVIIERKINKSFLSVYYKKNYKPQFGNLINTSGAERRHIINHDEFVKTVKKIYPDKKIINVSFEFLPIFTQYYLLHNAKIVIAQHGASLGEIVFMKPNTNVIEIISKSKLESGEDWFPPISKTCGINHYQYITDEEHTKIDVNDFKKFIKKNDL